MVLAVVMLHGVSVGMINEDCHYFSRMFTCTGESGVRWLR